MLKAYTAAEIYAAEAPALAAGEPLMARAAQGLAEVVIAHSRYGASVGVLAGRGNNGADALHAVEHLVRSGREVTVALAFKDDDAPEITLAALASARGSGARVIPIADPQEVPRELLGADVWVDGLAGIGMRAPAGGDLAELLTALEAFRVRAAESAPRVFAVDLPSGLGADVGRISGPILKADHTVTFGGYKPAHLLPPATTACGRLHLVDIGIASALAAAAVYRLEPADAQVRVPGSGDHKYTRGVLGLVTGSQDYPGAGVLSAAGAFSCGPGMVRYVGEVPGPVITAFPEAVTQPGRVQAWAVGSGVTGKASSSANAIDRAIAEALAAGVPIVVDAGAIDWVEPGRLAGEPASSRAVLTPHAGELANLLTRCGHEVSREDVESDPAGWAHLTREVTGASIVLKGATTITVTETGLYSQADGTPWLASAGTGDVLTGILGAVLAGWQARVESGEHAPFGEAVATGVMLHGLAGRRASRGGPIRASEIAQALPGVLRELLAH